jgi:hypothetical protein
VVVIILYPLPVVSERSTSKPVSLFDASVHPNVIAVAVVALTAKPDGAVGVAETVVAVISDVYTDVPPAFTERIL